MCNFKGEALGASPFFIFYRRGAKDAEGNFIQAGNLWLGFMFFIFHRRGAKDTEGNFIQAGNLSLVLCFYNSLFIVPFTYQLFASLYLCG